MNALKVYIDGNIGSGKSTILHRLATKPGVLAVAEPYNRWCALPTPHGQVDLIKRTFSLPDWHAFQLQSYIRLTFLQAHQETSPHAVKVMERSIHSGNLFVDPKHLTSCELAIEKQWQEHMLKNPDLHPDIQFYVQTEPRACMVRMLIRNRPEEVKNLLLDDFETLHERHERFFLHGPFASKVIPINGNQPKESMLDEAEMLLEKATYNLCNLPVIETYR